MDKDYIIWLEDVFSAVPDTTLRKMFGGVGLFRRGLMWGLALSDGRIAFKADAETALAYIAEGQKEWSHSNKSGGITKMGYWYIPEWLLDDTDALNEWANTAFDVAIRADNKKPPSKRKFKEL